MKKIIFSLVVLVFLVSLASLSSCKKGKNSSYRYSTNHFTNADGHYLIYVDIHSNSQLISSSNFVSSQQVFFNLISGATNDITNGTPISITVYNNQLYVVNNPSFYRVLDNLGESIYL